MTGSAGNTRPQATAVATLVAYYTTPRLPPAAWLRAVRDAKVAAFDAPDRDEALGIAADPASDPRRTLALARVAKPPASVGGFLSRAVPAILKNHVPGAAPDPEIPAAMQVGRIAAALAPALRERDRRKRNSAEAILLLTLLSAERAREMPPQDVLAALAPTLLGGANPETQARRLFRTARLASLRDLALGQQLAAEAVRAGEAMQRSLHGRIDSLDLALRNAAAEAEANRDLLAAAKAESTRLPDEAGALHEQIARLEHEALANRRQVRGLLSGRGMVLLTDAIEALAMQPPFVEAANERLKLLKKELERTIAWLEAPSA